MEIQSNTAIHVGRAVHYFAGYGGIDGRGVIAAVNGRAIDVILFDGRRLNGMTRIDLPGIGIKLLPQTHTADEIEAAAQHAAKYQSEQLLARLKAQQDFEAAEAARVIEHAPLFYWNGIKDQRGAKLQKCWYSDGEMRNHPAGTLTIYGRDYSGFSELVCACFPVQNDSDLQTDYFEKDRIRVIPTHPLYPQVKAAFDAQSAHNEKRFAKRGAK